MDTRVELLVLVIVVGVIWIAIRSSARKSFKSNDETPINITVSTRASELSEKNDVDVGRIQDAGEQGKIINPKSPLPLTIYGVTDSLLMDLVRYLKAGINWEQKLSEITYLIAQHNAGCREVDDYIRRQRKRVYARVTSLIDASDEWENASEKDQEDLLAEFVGRALEDLDEKPASDYALSTAIQKKPKDITADDELVKYFSGKTELYRFYVTRLGHLGKVSKVPAGDYYRKQYEALATIGLAIRGKDIETKKVLELLRVKDIHEMLPGNLKKKFKRKSDAIDYALTIPDIEDRVSRVISRRELFELVAPDNMDISEAQQCYQYAEAIATLIRDTYVAGYRTLETIQDSRGLYYDFWEVQAEDCCPSCEKLHGKKYKTRPRRLPPYHIGCQCEIDGG